MEVYIRLDRYSAVTPLHTGREACAPGHAYGPAVRTHWLLHFVFSGTGRYEVNGQTFFLRAGEAFLIKPGEVTRYEADADDPWDYLWVGFDSDLKALDELPYVIRNSRLARVMDDTARKLADGGDVNAICAVWNVVACLCGTLEETENTYILQAVTRIRQQYMEKLTVQSLADSVGLDRSYFSHLFKRDTGQSPGQYLLEYRMMIALKLLRCERYSVSVVAASVGYGDLFGFSRAFKSYYGVPPRCYKEITG